MRDLTGLVALPALWAGRDYYTVLQTLIEAVERLLPLRFVLIQTTVFPEHPPFERLRIDRAYVQGPALQSWVAQAREWSANSEPEGRAFHAPTPLGDAKILRLSLGQGQLGGSIWFGSQIAGFPTPAQLALARTAASLATTGLQASRAQHESEQASRAKDEFLAMLGHELRNPLAPIVTALELIKLRNSGELSREYRIIERQAAHLSRLVDDLLDVARIVRGKVELRKTLVNLTTALTHAVENVAPLMKERGHSFTIHAPNRAVWISGDQTRLVQIFTNLLTNSAKYSEPGSRIEVQARIDHSKVSIIVLDDGFGISPQLLPKLFTMFEQGRVDLARSQGGLGIGLALVKSFVELHGGSVTAHSAGDGAGSVFEVSLPLANAGEAEQISPAGEAESSPQPVRALVVDDNVDALESMETYLRLRGHEVRSCPSPIAALQVAAQFSPQVAILDIGLPEMDGYALAAELRKTFGPGSLRLIALTGYGQAKDHEQSQRAGFDVHLVKPVPLQELEKAMLTALRGIEPG